jgi:hypothetical protein
MEDQANLIELATDIQPADVFETVEEANAAGPVIPEVTDSLNVAHSEDAEDEEHSDERPIVFICHRQLPGLDENIAWVIHDALSADYDVYLDEDMSGGTLWPDAIQKGIEKADFVIALITEQANQINADWIAFELSLAHHRRQLTGKPTIIPVHLEQIGDYKAHIGASLTSSHRIDYKRDNARLIVDICRAIEGGPPIHDPSVLERYRVLDSRLKLMRAVAVKFPAFDNARALLAGDKLIWIVGDASVRNYAALSLAVQQQTLCLATETDTGHSWPIHEVSRPLRWSKVYNTLISNSIIILSDVAAASLFEEETQSHELDYLDLIISRNNFVIVTSSKDSFPDIHQEMRRQDFHRGGIIDATHDFYDERAKLEIFNKLLEFSEENIEISARQLEWARRDQVHETLSSVVMKLSPADIERFITWHLPEVKRPGEILRLLQRNADLDNEIHSWFVSLDDSIRCFVMVLALFADLSKKNLWTKYKEIIARLHKLDASLSLWPLGICRERAAQYVTTEGPLGFSEERIADAIHREMAKNYREYFLELLPQMEDWSVPAGRNGNRAAALSDGRRREAIKSQSLRNSIANMVGRMGQYGFNDLRLLIDRWATDPIMQVRDAVALSCQEAAVSSQGTQQVFRVLDEWCLNRSADDEALSRTWTAASALGWIAAAYPDRQVFNDAIDRLEALARDTRRSVRFYVSIPLKRVVRRVRLNDKIENLLSLVIQDGQVSTRINVAETLNEARIFNPETTLPVVDRWLSAEDPNQRWVALGSEILWWLRHGDKSEATDNLVGILLNQPEMFVGIFVEIVDHKYYRKQARAFFKQMVLDSNEEIRTALISGMAQIDFRLVFEKLLKRLKATGKPIFDDLIVEVRKERWRRLLPLPEDFTRDLNEMFRSGPVSTDVYRALIDTLKPEPEGCRRQAAAALADSFPHNHVEFDKLLRKLCDLAPSSLETFSVEARREGFVRLLHVPDLFVETVAEYFDDHRTVDQAGRAIEMMAERQPDGYREDLLQALAAAYALNKQATQRLLSLLRTSSEAARSLTYDFTLNLVEGALDEHEKLYFILTDATNDSTQLAEMVQVLKRLAISEPAGHRKALVHALAVKRISQSEIVDNLLQHPAFLAEPELSGLRLEVKLNSVLSRVFVPKLLTRLFRPR